MLKCINLFIIVTFVFMKALYLNGNFIKGGRRSIWIIF